MKNREYYLSGMRKGSILQKLLNIHLLDSSVFHSQIHLLIQKAEWQVWRGDRGTDSGEDKGGERERNLSHHESSPQMADSARLGPGWGWKLGPGWGWAGAGLELRAGARLGLKAGAESWVQAGAESWGWELGVRRLESALPSWLQAQSTALRQSSHAPPVDLSLPWKLSSQMHVNLCIDQLLCPLSV